ncbi:hypothetical protein COCNU_16G000440 [Cocos nucifera]|uniref:Uncharacterized protein n=1 Tax=Cocos nucifera TaxID=13894 RepID=A0A8K0IXS1_COCNU|nr:hypothetical protein COCNU_16G000440 [Cocos nucifera]
MMPPVVSSPSTSPTSTSPTPSRRSSPFSGLRYLNLSNNVFNGIYPSELSRLKNLHVLDLYNNNLIGILPIMVVDLPILHHLHLGGNFFSRAIPSKYSRWEHIEYLTISVMSSAAPSYRSLATSLPSMSSTSATSTTTKEASPPPSATSPLSSISMLPTTASPTRSY